MSSANNYTTILREKKDVMLQLKKSKETYMMIFEKETSHAYCIKISKKKKKKITTNELIKKFRKNNLIAAESTMRDSNAELIFFGKRYLPCITG